MSSYRDIEGQLRGKTNAKILILDTNNLQFYYQHQDTLPPSDLFQPYDMVFIPGWVHAEYVHHTGKSEYVTSIPTAIHYIDEFEDYLPMVGYQDTRLMELFRLASPYGEAQRFLVNTDGCQQMSCLMIGLSCFMNRGSQRDKQVR